jgi:DNA polymerase-3 subunit epsilon
MPEILNFLDIETTGGSYGSDQIIELAILKVQNDEIIDEFSTLIKPTIGIDPYAQKIHGITNQMLADAPKFEEIYESIYEYLSEGTIVAHNARFDYSFIRNSFENIGIDFARPYACTVKLSRFLYPHHPRHGLSHIIERFGIEIKDRHRAMGDTKATFYFYLKAKNEHDPQIFQDAFKKSILYSAIPSKLLKFDFKTIPNTPGIYIFKNEDGIPIYVGKSIHLQDRVKQHFYGSSRSTKEMDIAREVADIEIIETVGEFGALLREALWVKKHKPKYNHMLKKSYSFYIQKTTNTGGYFVPVIKMLNKNHSFDFANTLGLFTSKADAKNFLEHVKAKNNLCGNLLNGKKDACFGYHLGTCFGACIKKESPEEYNKRFSEAFRDYSLQEWTKDEEFIHTENSLLDGEDFTIKNWVFVESDRDLKNESTDFDYDIYRILRRFITEV